MSCNHRTDLDPTSFDDLRVLSDDAVAPTLADAPAFIAKRIQEVSDQRTSSAATGQTAAAASAAPSQAANSVPLKT